MITEMKHYMEQHLSARQRHIDMDQKCLERGGNSTNHRGVLAEFLKTEIPVGKVDLCHYCGNGLCSNPHHLYWGTRKENVGDAIRHGTRLTVWQRSVNKYGFDGACKINSYNGLGNVNGRGNLGKPKTAAHAQKVSDSIKELHKAGHYKDSPLGRKKTNNHHSK